MLGLSFDLESLDLEDEELDFEVESLVLLCLSFWSLVLALFVLVSLSLVFKSLAWVSLALDVKSLLFVSFAFESLVLVLDWVFVLDGVSLPLAFLLLDSVFELFVSWALVFLTEVLDFSSLSGIAAAASFYFVVAMGEIPYIL